MGEESRNCTIWMAFPPVLVGFYYTFHSHRGRLRKRFLMIVPRWISPALGIVKIIAMLL